MICYFAFITTVYVIVHCDSMYIFINMDIMVFY